MKVVKNQTLYSRELVRAEPPAELSERSWAADSKKIASRPLPLRQDPCLTAQSRSPLAPSTSASERPGLKKRRGPRGHMSWQKIHGRILASKPKVRGSQMLATSQLLSGSTGFTQKISPNTKKGRATRATRDHAAAAAHRKGPPRRRRRGGAGQGPHFALAFGRPLPFTGSSSSLSSFKDAPPWRFLSSVKARR